MILYVIRHGEPDYQKDTLTENGFKQAQKLGERLKNLKIDKLYVSTHGRAIATAQPIIDSHKEVKPQFIDWAREDNGGRYFFTMVRKDFATWFFFLPKMIKHFKSEKVLKLGNNWCKDSKIKKTPMPEGYKQMSKWVDDFFLKCGYKHNRRTHQYIKVGESPNVVVIVAHGGFANSFISNLLDTPYPLFTSTHIDMGLTAITTIELKEDRGGFPYILTYNDNTHLN